jgi:hypothetical protein
MPIGIVKYCIMQSSYPANAVWAWCPIDTEELYQQNRLNQAKLLRRYGWWEHEPFDYRFNSHGFRSQEFDSHTPSILYLGCSMTMGIGLPVESTWPTIVSRTMQLNCWNMGQGGGSMDTCFRLAEYWIPRLSPTRVMMLCPMAERIEVVDDRGVAGFYTAQDHATPMVEAWLKHPDNSRLNYSKNIKAIQQICNEHTIPFHSWPVAELGNIKEANGLARDLQHVGAEYHLKFAEQVLSVVVDR